MHKNFIKIIIIAHISPRLSQYVLEFCASATVKVKIFVQTSIKNHFGPLKSEVCRVGACCNMYSVKWVNTECKQVEADLREL